MRKWVANQISLFAFEKYMATIEGIFESNDKFLKAIKFDHHHE